MKGGVLFHLTLLFVRAFAALWERDPQNPIELDTLLWSSTGCPVGYAFCGRLEFCLSDATHYAFRLPGKPCLPGRGPTIRMQAGKKYQLTLQNSGIPGIERHSATIHTHGLHIDVNGNSDNLLRYVEAGECIKYTWNIPANHMGGTFLYYSMLHRSSEVHVNGGAFGALIIEDNLGIAPNNDIKAWMQNELLLLGAKLEVQSLIKSQHEIRIGHGYYHVPLQITADRWYRVRLVVMQHLGQPGQVVFGDGTQCQVHAVAYDGVWGSSIPINGPSEPRHYYDMILHMDLALKCSAGQHAVRIFGGSVYTLVASPATSPSPATPFLVSAGSSTRWTVNNLPGYLQNTLTLSIPSNLRMTLQMSDGYINSKAWDASVPITTLNIGQVVEWTIKSTRTGPFHLQGYPMQVVGGRCGWHTVGQWYTVISAKPGNTDVVLTDEEDVPDATWTDDCTVRIRAVDFGGRVIMRSQYLELGDWGTMAWADVKGGPAADTTDLSPFRCASGSMCLLDGSCTPLYQCNSMAGKDNCGGPCLVSSAPQCPSNKPHCDPLKNVCSNSKATLNTIGTKVVAPPTTLVTLQWKSTGCAPTYDFCGDLEFCAIGLTQYAFRLPGKPCLPAHAPVIRMTPGKKYQLWLHNRAELRYKQHVTNLHTHGIHVSGDGNADDITREVHPFEVLKYTWVIPADHLGGTFWYHCHVHEITRLQVAGGAFGMLIIDDPPHFPNPPPYTDTVAAFRMYLENEVLLIASKVGNTFLGNGNSEEPLYIKAREWYRMRIVGVDPEVKPKDIIIADQNCDCHRMQHDGVWNTVIPANVVPRTTWTMTGASRIEVAIRCRNAGTYNIRWFGGVVAKLVVSGSGVITPASPWLAGYGKQWDTDGARPVYLKDLTKYPGEIEKYEFVVKHGFINDLAYDANTPHRNFDYDQVVEWTLKGTAGHAFHLHVWHMQVVTPGGCGMHEYGQWYDVISASNGGDCKVRFRFADLRGRTIFHCHYLMHEDLGTMGWVNVVNRNNPNEPPIDTTDLLPVESQPGCRWDGRTCTPYYDCGSSDGYDNCGRPCRCSPAPSCASGLVCSTMQKECIPDPYRRSTLPSMYGVEAQQRWGYSIGHMDQLSRFEVPQLEAIVLRTLATERADYAEGFHSHVFVMRMMEFSLSVTAVDPTLFDAAIISWGGHSVVRAVVTSFEPSNASLDRLGITRHVGSYPPVLLLQIDRLTPDGQFANENPMKLRVQFPAAVPMEVFLHDTDHPDGVPLAAAGGSIAPSDEPHAFVITVPHTSLISVLAPVELAPSDASSSGKAALWAGLAASALIVIVGAVGLTWYCSRAQRLREYAIMELAVTEDTKPLPQWDNPNAYPQSPLPSETTCHPSPMHPSDSPSSMEEGRVQLVTV